MPTCTLQCESLAQKSTAKRCYQVVGVIKWPLAVLLC